MSSPHGTHNLYGMQNGQSTEEDHQLGLSPHPPSFYQNLTSTYFVLPEQNGSSVSSRSFPVHQIPSTAPRSSSIAMPPAQPMFDSGANPPRGSNPAIYYVPSEDVPPMNLGQIGYNNPAILSPGRTASSSFPSPAHLPAPSSASPATSSGHHSYFHYPPPPR